jgi:hypothetical protein
MQEAMKYSEKDIALYKKEYEIHKKVPSRYLHGIEYDMKAAYKRRVDIYRYQIKQLQSQ